MGRADNSGVTSKYLEEGYEKEDNVVGKHRLLDLGGKHIHEILTSLSDAEHFYTYHITKVDEGLFPGSFANYHARMSFKRVTDTNATFAEWSAELMARRRRRRPWSRQLGRACSRV